jgi:hypothetical protein
MQDFVSRDDAVIQAIKTRLLLLLGEWWEDQTDGTPLFQNILGVVGTSENLEAVDLIVQDIIINTDNVNEIVEFTSNYDNRSYSIFCTVNTAFNTTTTIEVNL